MSKTNQNARKKREGRERERGVEIEGEKWYSFTEGAQKGGDHTRSHCRNTSTETKNPLQPVALTIFSLTNY